MYKSTLIPVVTLGTLQEPRLPEPPTVNLNPLWRSIDTSDLPQAILQAAAIEQSLYSTGSELIKVTSDLLDPCPADTVDVLTPSAILATIHMMRGEHNECLLEWLNLIAKRQLRAPSSMIPTLLDYGTKKENLRSVISSLVSVRGFWLAKQYKEWRWVENYNIEVLTPEHWHTGNNTQRLHYINNLQESDPKQASELILSDWNNEDPNIKVKLITLVNKAFHNLHHHEAWLQVASNDPRKVVRTAATRVLLLFHSAYRQRAIERAKEFITLCDKTLKINPPQSFNKAWICDGIKLKIPTTHYSLKGEKAGWLYQILSRVPLDHWQTMLDTHTPLHKLKLDPDWSDLIQAAKAEASTFTHNLETLISYFKIDHSEVLIQQRLRNTAQSLPIEQAYQLLNKLISIVPDAAIMEALQGLKSSPHTSFPNINKFILKKLLNSHNTIYKNEAKLLALCIHPNDIPTVLKAISKAKMINNSTDEFANLLEFRQSYLNTL